MFKTPYLVRIKVSIFNFLLFFGIVIVLIWLCIIFIIIQKSTQDKWTINRR